MAHTYNEAEAVAEHVSGLEEVHERGYVNGHPDTGRWRALRCTIVMLDPAIKALLAAIDQAWEVGCPVAGPATREQLASTALRRWRSSHRRARERNPSDNARIEDLAKALRDALEANPGLVGPLMEDYRYLARVLAPVLKHVTHE